MNFRTSPLAPDNSTYPRIRTKSAVRSNEYWNQLLLNYSPLCCI
jgi:hypothetical protein